jgi:hypothetical protein
MKTSPKIILLSAAVFLLAAGCNQTQPQVNNQPLSQQQAGQPAAVTQPAKSPDIRPWFKETVDGSKYNQPQTQFTIGQNALEVLDATYQITTKDYGSMGKFVESIDDISPDSKHFWEFFVNGKSSNVGASSYVLKAGDKIEWKLSAINSSGE